MIIYIAVILTLVLIVNILPIVLSMISPKPEKPLSLENDIMFLNSLISIAINDYEKYVIQPSKAAGRSIMTDEEVNKYIESIILNIWSQMSDNYVKILYRYYSPEGLRYYISNTIVNEINSKVLSYNLKFLNIISDKKDDGVNVSRTDI
jgi:hypothetical protein